jgi:hypothetical protein
MAEKKTASRKGTTVIVKEIFDGLVMDSPEPPTWRPDSPVVAIQIDDRYGDTFKLESGEVGRRGDYVVRLHDDRLVVIPKLIFESEFTRD